ncbi:hypothetical protein BCR34DRAFT_665425 [Clohesyomyces aquaticus]|uniref:Oxidoreductase n=1 Tax=Clohesyomyces aquaticus TaxID=1231657 RepID=A0A1Y1ZH49_9PLEO|nr:hypothetical protein BCR34DRAFT_665425 [Clohesyomyces aquaticus]
MSQTTLGGYTIVTGAASGIGKETALAFAEAGAKGVLFGDLQAEKVAEVAEESKKSAASDEYKAVSCKVDITNVQSIQDMVALALKEFGRVDYLVNSAGADIKALAPFHETSDEDFDRVLNVNAKGAYLVSKAVAVVIAVQEPVKVSTKRFGERTLSRGAIVNVASAMAFGAVPGKTPYITSKHALLGITRASAMDLNRAGIRVNIVSPTWVNTPMLDGDRERVPHLDQLIKEILPIGRAAEPDEVAAAVLYLCGPGATYVTGANIMIDGGLSIGPSL